MFSSFFQNTALPHDNELDFFRFEKSIVIQPGDELRMICIYKTKHQEKTVFYGNGVQDEMCYGHLAYYPVLETGDDSCSSFGGRLKNQCKSIDRELN